MNQPDPLRVDVDITTPQTRDFSRLATVQRYPNNLPLQLSHFIGREQAIADIKRAVWTTRLLTLTRPGICGKTRLSMPGRKVC